MDVINIKEEDREDENIRVVELSKEQISFMQNMIRILDSAKKLNLHGLSLFYKILNNKETK